MTVFKFVSGIAVGFYTGLYVAKNYNIPNVAEPGEIYDTIIKTLEKYKKNKPDD